MIASATFTPRTFAPGGPRQAVQAGGGSMGRFDDHGHLVIQQDVLGFIPVQVSVRVGDIIAGKYGRDFRLDFTDPQHATLTGTAHYGPFAMGLNEPLNLQSGGMLQDLAVHVNDDKTLQLQGHVKLLGMVVPVEANVTPQEVADGVFHFTFNSLKAGQSGMSLPPVFAAWTTSFCMGVFGGLKGIKATDLNQLEVNFAQLKLPDPPA
jgi:hypothetical protein